MSEPRTPADAGPLPIASAPTGEVAVPDVIARMARGSELTPIWVNQIGGVTFRTDDGRILKHGPRTVETSFSTEAERIAWAAPHTPVPEVLEVGGDDASEWMSLVELPGLSAVDPRWVAEPEIAVRAVGAGLRALHDALPVADCPFDWGVASRVENAAARGIRVPDELRDPPPIDRLVVCHGDPCCPNTLLDDTGAWSAHVDLGALGVADRWADIAVASLSTLWNYGPGWEDTLIEAYGVVPDRERIEYYRALWNAT